jgi:catechol 2,3-dioxygenase-like lactoylglutathione lyase family enzyme
MIKEANVTVMVTDLNRAVKLYTETLGLKLKARYADQFAQVVAPSLTIALHPAGKNTPQPGRSHGLSIGFSVDNLEEMTKDLSNKGVVFGEVVDDRAVKLAFFSDSDRTPLYLSQSKWG